MQIIARLCKINPYRDQKGMTPEQKVKANIIIFLCDLLLNGLIITLVLWVLFDFKTTPLTPIAFGLLVFLLERILKTSWESITNGLCKVASSLRFK